MQQPQDWLTNLLPEYGPKRKVFIEQGLSVVEGISTYNIATWSTNAFLLSSDLLVLQALILSRSEKLSLASPQLKKLIPEQHAQPWEMVKETLGKEICAYYGKK